MRREWVVTGMATEDPPEETTVSDRGMVTIPAEIRRHLEIDAGDKISWDVDDDGKLTIEVVHQREGVFDDFEPIDAGPTNAVDVESEFGTE
jgi:AbrB family looped-hinge helix DNA binding protein